MSDNSYLLLVWCQCFCSWIGDWAWVLFIFLFYFFSLSVLLSFAEEERKHPPSTEEERKHPPEEEERKHSPNCPPFDCEKLGWLHFPFNNEKNPECGLCTVTRCTEELPWIQLERGGRYFGVKNISQAGTIVIQDQQLQGQLKHRRCDFINNITSSLSPSISFIPVRTLYQFSWLHYPL